MNPRWLAYGLALSVGCGAKTSSPDGPAPNPPADASAVDAAPSRADTASSAPDAAGDRNVVADSAADRTTPDSSGSTGACPPAGTGFDTSITGVAVDRATCLAWERNDPPKDKGTCLIARDSDAKLCFDEAVNYCRTLRLDARSDWRLPTATELRTIVVPASYPALDKTTFPQALISLYWTSDRNGEKVVCLDFSNAGMLNDHIGPDGPQGVRCVRGGR
jgi:Protein of unknown function (DUF1566)